MNDSSAGGGPSNLNDVSCLVRKVREEFVLLNADDSRWPCPFCFHKSATVVQCHIHVSKEHPNLYKTGRPDLLISQQSKTKNDFSVSQERSEDLDDFLRLLKDDKARRTETIVCQRCTHQVKECKGFNGLKVHYSRVHKEFMTDFIKQSQGDSVNVNSNGKTLPNRSQREETNKFKCRVESCPRSFASQNGLKIHVAKCHKDSLVDFGETDFPRLIQCYRSGVKVIRRIPRGARISVAMKLSSLMNDCVVINSAEVWQSLFLFSYRVLNVKRSNPKHTSLTKTIKDNVLKNNFDVRPEAPVKVSLKNIIESKVADGDIRGAIRILSSADSIAPENDATFEILQQKHPVPVQTIKPNAPIGIVPLAVTEDQVKKSIFSFAPGSSGGIDGLSPQHFKDLSSLNCGDAASQLLSSITKLSNLLLSGNVCQDFVPFLYGASLVAFNKKDGGIRPIAIGATLRRLVSKLCCADICGELVPKLQPKQFGFGVKGGSEAVVHGIRTFIQQDKSAEVIVKVDVGNAFNSLDRVSFLKDIEEKFPRLYPYMFQCYASPTNLFYNKSIILSATGCQQGDPLGPAVFSLGINDIIQALTSDLNVWYLDDGTLGGKADCVVNDLVTLKDRFRSLGMELNTSKCEAFIFPDISEGRKHDITTQLIQAAPGISFVSEINFCLLGAPILEPAIETSFEQKQQTVEFFIERLRDINPHVALFLLQHSLWIPRLTYLLRCTPLFKFKHLLANLDTKIQQALESILNIKFSQRTWLQCSMPVKFGGIGIRSCEDLATPAFLSSIHSAKSLVGSMLQYNVIEIAYSEDALMEWKSLSLSPTMPEDPTLQSNWDLPIIRRNLEKKPPSFGSGQRPHASSFAT